MKDFPTASTISVPVHPDRPDDVRTITLGKTLAIAGKDFNNHQGKEVRLLHLFNVSLSDTSHVTSVDNKKIPKIQWVSDGVAAKVLLVDGTWVDGLVEPAALKLKKDAIVQFERFGFVRFDGVHNGVPTFWFAHG